MPELTFRKVIDQEISSACPAGYAAAFDQLMSESRNVTGFFKGFCDQRDEFNPEIQAKIAVRLELFLKVCLRCPVLQSLKEISEVVRLVLPHERVLIEFVNTQFLQRRSLNSPGL